MIACNLSIHGSIRNEYNFYSFLVQRRVTRMPKKTSELTVVNSESEEEDGEEEEGAAKDNLNLAINLNDSFIFTPSKMMIFTPLKLSGNSSAQDKAAHVECTVEPPKAPAPVQRSSIFSVGSGGSTENDKNLVNFQVKKDFSAELEKLAINDPPNAGMVKSQSTSALGANPPQALKTKKLATDDHGDIIRYRPINQKRVLEQQKQALQQTVSKSQESTDSGISTAIRVFPAKDIPDSITKPPHDPVFATPGFTKAPVQMSGSRRVPNPRMPVSSATKNQSAIKEEFQQRKVLFTTPMGGSCKPVSSIANASISLALDESLQFAPSSRAHLPEVSEKVLEEEEDQENEKDKRQVRRIKNNDYAVEKKIGHGGSSTVFLGRRLDTDQEVALKVVDLQGDEAIIRGYLKETELLASLQGNPNIITLFD